MKPEETIDFNIKAAWHGINRMYNQKAEKYGATTSVAIVLLNIHEQGTPATKIAPKLGMETRSLTRTLKTLEGRGMIYRKPDLLDKRVVLIFLTPEGIEKRNEAKQAVIDFNEKIKNALTTEERNTFFNVIGKINQLVEEEKFEK